MLMDALSTDTAFEVAFRRFCVLLGFDYIAIRESELLASLLHRSK